MAVGEVCNREVVVVETRESVLQAAQLMRRHHVGDLVVVERDAAGARPVGILTDRDIVVELVAAGVDLQAVTVGDAMSYRLVTVAEGAELDEAVRTMAGHGVRRAPVVDGAGRLVGLLALDDVLELLSEQLGELVRLVGREQRHEAQQRR